MASKTQIANRALSKLGHPRVSNVDTTDTLSARTISEMWDSVRDAVLQAYPWNFAIKRASVPAESTAPVYGWDKQFLLPVDFLQLLDIQDSPDYRVEGGKILTNALSPLKFRYIARIEDTAQFTPLFNEAFSARLAYEGAEKITQSNTKKDFLFNEYRLLLAQAQQSDAIEDPVIDPEDDDWVRARA